MILTTVRQWPRFQLCNYHVVFTSIAKVSDVLLLLCSPYYSPSIANVSGVLLVCSPYYSPSIANVSGVLLVCNPYYSPSIAKVSDLLPLCSPNYGPTIGKVSDMLLLCSLYFSPNKAIASRLLLLYTSLLRLSIAKDTTCVIILIWSLLCPFEILP